MKLKLETTNKSFNSALYEKHVWTTKRYPDESVGEDLSRLLRRKMTWEQVHRVVEKKATWAFLKEMERTERFPVEKRNFLICFVAVMMYYKELDKGYKLVKSIFRSAVHFVRPLEASQKLEDIVQSNALGVHNSTHEESGFVMLNLSQFQSQTLSDVSLGKFVFLRDSIISGKKTRYVDALNHFLCSEPLHEKSLTKVARFLKEMKRIDQFDDENDFMCAEPLHEKNLNKVKRFLYKQGRSENMKKICYREENLFSFKQQKATFIDFSRWLPKGYCFYVAFIVSLYQCKTQLFTYDELQDLDYETCLTVICEGNEEHRTKLLEWKDKTRYLKFADLQDILIELSDYYRNYNIIVFKMVKKPKRVHLTMNSQGGYNKKNVNLKTCTKMFNKLYESKKITLDENNPYRQFENDEQRELHNTMLERRSTIQLLLENINPKKFHCVSLLSKKFQYLTHEKQALYVCDTCQRYYRYQGKHKECKGYYRDDRINYTTHRQYYEPQHVLFHESRNTFPYYMTFDCETETVGERLLYYCHSVTLFCVNASLAEKTFGRDSNGQIRHQWSFYYKDTFDSMRQLFEKCPVALQGVVNPVLAVVRKQRFNEYERGGNVDGLKSLRVFDLIALAQLLVDFAETQRQEHTQLNISLEDRERLWQTERPECTICKLTVDKRSALERHYRRGNEYQTSSAEHASLRYHLYGGVTKVNYFQLGRAVQQYLKVTSREQVETDLLFLFRVYVVLYECSRLGRVENGTFCRYFMMSNDDMLVLLQRVTGRSSYEDMMNNTCYFYTEFEHACRHIKTTYADQSTIFEDRLFYLFDFTSSLGVVGELFQRVVLCTVDHSIYKSYVHDVFQQPECAKLLHNKIEAYFDYAVIDHDHWTGEVLGLAHHYCNLNYGRVKKPVVNIYAHNAAFDNLVFITAHLEELSHYPWAQHYSTAETNKEYFGEIMEGCSLGSLFATSESLGKIKNISFKHVRFLDSLKILNCSLEEATRNLDANTKEMLRCAILDHLHKTGFVNYEKYAEMMADAEGTSYFTGKSTFPYEKINDVDLNVECQEPVLEDFLGNFLSKAKDETHERLMLSEPFENVKRLWLRLQLKNYGQLLHIYNVIDTISLAFVLYDFDARIYQQLKFHVLPFISIFSFSSKYNSYIGNVAVQHPPTKRHHQLIEKCMKGGMSTNGSQSICVSTDSFTSEEYTRDDKLHFMAMMYDENSQYGGAQTKYLGIGMETEIHGMETLEDVLNKYDMGEGYIHSGAMVHCVLRIKKEKQSSLGGISACVVKESCNVTDLSAFEIYDKRVMRSDGTLTISINKGEKLVYKYGEHETVETMDRLKWLISTQGVQLVKILNVFGVVMTKMAYTFVTYLSQKRQEANRRGDKVSDNLFKLMTNGHYGWTARDVTKYKDYSYTVNAQENVRKTCTYLQNACRELLQQHDAETVRGFLPATYRHVIMNFMDEDFDTCCIDTKKKDLVFDGVDTYNEIYASNIIQSVLHYDTRSVNSIDLSGGIDILYSLEENEKFTVPVAILKNKRGVNNTSLRIVACHVLAEAKRSISHFATVLQNALTKVQAHYELIMTDTDSLCVAVYGKGNDFTQRVERCLREDADFNALMDYSNYPKDHPLYSNAKQKHPHHFQNEYPAQHIDMAVALGPKCYEIVKGDAQKMRAKGFPKQHLHTQQYLKGIDLFVLENYFDASVKCIKRKMTDFETHRLMLTAHQVEKVERNMSFMKNLNSKYYVLDCGLRLLRDDERLQKIHVLNKTVVNDLNAFCSDGHLYKLLQMEKEIIFSNADLAVRYWYMKEFVLPVIQSLL